MLHGEEEVLGSKYNKKCFAESKWCDGRSKKKKRCKKKSKKCKQCFPCEKCEKCNKKCLKKKMCQFFTDQRALTLQRQKPKKCAACMKKCEKKVCEHTHYLPISRPLMLRAPLTQGVALGDVQPQERRLVDRMRRVRPRGEHDT